MKPAPPVIRMCLPAQSTGRQSTGGPLQQTEGVLAGQLWRLGKHSAIYGLGAVVWRLIGVLLLPIITRYLTRADVGAVDTLISLSVVLVIVLRAGISMAFFRYYFDAEDDAGRDDGGAHLVLVHDGDGHRRPRHRLDPRAADLAPPVHDRLARQPRPRRARDAGRR